MEWLSRLEAPANALAVLTAMITPAVLISACGALIFSTATRLGRVVDVGKVSRKYAGEKLASRSVGGPMTWLGRKIG